MSKGGRDHFERFEDHTLLKHLILDKYLKAWAFKLLRWGKQVWFVDAFAGVGGDKAGRPGSPVIAARIAEKLLKKKGPTEQGAAPMQVLAIELDLQRFERLQEAMRPYTESEPSLAAVRQGTLQDCVDPFVEHGG